MKALIDHCPKCGTEVPTSARNRPRVVQEISTTALVEAYRQVLSRAFSRKEAA